MAEREEIRDGAISRAIVGFGAVGEILWRCMAADGLSPERCVVFEPDAKRASLARSLGLCVVEARVEKESFERVVGPWLHPGMLLVNLGIDVDTIDMIGLCQGARCLYVDAGIELWPDRFPEGAPHPTVGQCRADVLSSHAKGSGMPTAIIGHGANPGLASHWAKMGLRILAEEHGLDERWAAEGGSWGWLARSLGVRVIQIAERDHGKFQAPEGAFANTWSVDGLARESMQRGEMGWGSHEERAPLGKMRSATVGDSAGTRFCALPRPGFACMAKTWTPLGGVGVGFMVTHLESIGLSAALSLDGYAPSCYYAYQPCAQAAAGLKRLGEGSWAMGGPAYIPGGADIEGIDELGALLMGERFGSIWVGSRLASDQARLRIPGASATTLQVAAGLMGAIEWALSHPAEGLKEPEDLPDEWILKRAERWIGESVWARSRAIEPLDRPVPCAAEDLRVGHFLV